MEIVFDGSFESLLSIAKELYDKKIDFSFISTKSGLFSKTFPSNSYKESFKEVIEFIGKDIKLFYRAYLCDYKNPYTNIAKALMIVFKNKKLIQNITLEPIKFIHDLNKTYGRELHKWEGFLRFQETKENLLYAPFLPKADVILDLSFYFSKRLKEPFVIHDIKRKKAFIRQQENFDIIENIEKIDLDISDKELYYEKLWKTFFDRVSIRERENKKVQRNFVPLWYRKYMTEFK